METQREVVSEAPDWFEDPAQVLSGDMAVSAKHGTLPREVAARSVRLGIQRWPDGKKSQFHARLSDPLKEVMRLGGRALDEAILPPAPLGPLDIFRHREAGSDAWSAPIRDLEISLAVALANGYSRHFGIEYELIVKLNAKWGLLGSATITPRALLTAFGFDPAQFSLYKHDSHEPLPPDTSFEVKRGECFEAQKDGRYGSPTVAFVKGAQSIEQDVQEMVAAGHDAGLFVEGGQRYVEVRNLPIPSPPWSGGKAAILIAVPATYPQGGLDAFYLEQGVNLGGGVPYQQAPVNIAGRNWGLISWHYANGYQWDASRDDLASHVVHCRGFFLKRGVR